MTYEMALDYEQDQRYEQSLIAQGYSDCEAQADISRGPGKLCACGLMQAQDHPGCKGPF